MSPTVSPSESTERIGLPPNPVDFMTQQNPREKRRGFGPKAVGGGVVAGKSDINQKRFLWGKRGKEGKPSRDRSLSCSISKIWTMVWSCSERMLEQVRYQRAWTVSEGGESGRDPSATGCPKCRSAARRAQPAEMTYAPVKSGPHLANGAPPPGPCLAMLVFWMSVDFSCSALAPIV